MDEFFDQVRAFILANNLLPPGARVLAGISGGADSLALLLVLNRLREPLKLDLSVAHINHGLRGEAADDDEAFVRDWCMRLDIPFFCRTVDVRALAADAGISLEDAGRQARQACFADIAPGALVALAHHLDDQAETLLLHLGRGSGLDGLTGMKPRSGQVIRPLLGQSRRAIENWLSGQSVVWRQDATNLDDFALRNRLRHQVLPAWRQALGYDPAPLLSRTAALLAEDRQYLDSQTRLAINACRLGTSLDAAAVLDLPLAIQNRVLRLFWLERTGSSCDLSGMHIRQLQGLLRPAGRFRFACLPGSWRASSDGRRLDIDRFRPEATAPLPDPLPAIPLELPGKTILPQFNLEITALLIENDREIVYNNGMEYFQLARITGSVVRGRLPGDRIHPAGRQGGKSLKKFLNERKIPLDLRDRLPVVALGSEIIWLPGYASGSDFVSQPGERPSGPLVQLVARRLKQEDL